MHRCRSAYSFLFCLYGKSLYLVGKVARFRSISSSYSCDIFRPNFAPGYIAPKAGQPTLTAAHYSDKKFSELPYFSVSNC